MSLAHKQQTLRISSFHMLSMTVYVFIQSVFWFTGSFLLLTHSFPVHFFSTPWKHQKIWCFQGVEKGCIENEWVKNVSFHHISSLYSYSHPNKVDIPIFFNELVSSIRKIEFFFIKTWYNKRFYHVLMLPL